MLACGQLCPLSLKGTPAGGSGYIIRLARFCVHFCVCVCICVCMCVCMCLPVYVYVFVCSLVCVFVFAYVWMTSLGGTGQVGSCLSSVTDCISMHLYACLCDFL